MNYGQIYVLNLRPLFDNLPTVNSKELPALKVLPYLDGRIKTAHIDHHMLFNH